MPGGTARLRVRRHYEAVGKRDRAKLEGLEQFGLAHVGMFRVNDDREQLGIAAVFAMAKAIRRAQTSCARVSFAALARRTGAGGRCRMICSESAAAQHEPPLARRSGGRSIPG